MKTIITVIGPTASGKTEQSIQLAKKLNTEIISADSRQFFRELTIGTAKPLPEQLKQVPHHFINTLSIQQNYNAGIYETDALELIDRLFKKHDELILTGGSGIYINAVLKGFDHLPEADKEIRNGLKNDLITHGIEYLQNELLKMDKAYYHTVDLKNPQRLMRALEVCIITGKPYSELLHKYSTAAKRNFSVKIYGLDTERNELYKRINYRVDKMIKNGLIEEARSLLPFRNHNALQTVGYKELFDYFNGMITREEAIEAIKKNTRNYAKRQLTWFRKMEGVEWVRSIM